MNLGDTNIWSMAVAKGTVGQRGKGDVVGVMSTPLMTDIFLGPEKWWVRLCTQVP